MTMCEQCRERDVEYERKLEIARKVLEKLEWDDCDYEFGSVYCKLCEMQKDEGHKSDCEFKAALAAMDRK